jgi:hypothetical protein
VNTLFMCFLRPNAQDRAKRVASPSEAGNENDNGHRRSGGADDVDFESAMGVPQ